MTTRCSLMHWNRGHELTGCSSWQGEAPLDNSKLTMSGWPSKHACTHELVSNTHIHNYWVTSRTRPSGVSPSLFLVSSPRLCTDNHLATTQLPERTA